MDIIALPMEVTRQRRERGILAISLCTCRSFSNRETRELCRRIVLGSLVNRCQGVKITPIGGKGDFGIAVEIGDTFSHRKPTDYFLAVTSSAAPDLEFIRTIDDGLDTQYAAVFVVHFYPVLFHPVFHPCAGPTLFVIVADFALEAPVEFSTEFLENQCIL